MSIYGASVPHFFVTVVIALFAIQMIFTGDFATRVAGILLLAIDVVLFGRFYEKL